jgi:hypothetical protein
MDVNHSPMHDELTMNATSMNASSNLVSTNNKLCIHMPTSIGYNFEIKEDK